MTTTYEFIGGGGFGHVRLQHHQHPPLAEKLIPKTRNKSCMRTAVERECRALERLRHPNIVGYYGFYEEVNFFVIKMELCKRGGLNQVLADRRVTYSVRTALCWCEHLFSSLNYLKQQQIIHRDIKPANVFVSNEFHLKIGDFGCVLQFHSHEPETFVGTFRYMSPEMIVFSLFTEKHSSAPVDREEFRHSDFFGIARDDEMTPIQEPECFDDLKLLIKQCVDYTPQNRPEPEQALEIVKQLQRTMPVFDFYVFEPKIHENEEILRRPLGIFGKYEEEGGFVLETQKSHMSAENLKGLTVPDGLSLTPDGTNSSSSTDSELTHPSNSSSDPSFEVHPGDRVQKVANFANNPKEMCFPADNASHKPHFLIPGQPSQIPPASKQQFTAPAPRPSPTAYPSGIYQPRFDPKPEPNQVHQVRQLQNIQPPPTSKQQFIAQAPRPNPTPYPTVIYQPSFDPRPEPNQVRQVQNIQRPSTSSYQSPNRSMERNHQPTSPQVHQVRNMSNNQSHPVPNLQQDPFPQKIHQPGCRYYRESQQSENSEENFLETQSSDDLDDQDSDSESPNDLSRLLRRQIENGQARQDSFFQQPQTNLTHPPTRYPQHLLDSLNRIPSRQMQNQEHDGLIQKLTLGLQNLMSYFNEDQDQHFLQYTNREQHRNRCAKRNRKFLSQRAQLFSILSKRLSEMKQIENGYTFSLSNPPDFKKFATNEERAFLEEVTNCVQDCLELREYQHYMVDRILFIEALYELFQTVLIGLYRVNKCQARLNPQWIQNMLTRCDLLDLEQIVHCKGFNFRTAADRCSRIFYVLQENFIDQGREKCILMQDDFKIGDPFVEQFRLLQPIPSQPITLSKIRALLQTCSTLNFLL
ncbi:unnamed protein product, partial [Mesorhabditis belari]|uniref:Protein kinase domain-containing protein n=1 Tax=Mesorhabditis belari TaxID=2138241 RepID=A0AAF3EGD6_9BILA